MTSFVRKNGPTIRRASARSQLYFFDLYASSLDDKGQAATKPSAKTKSDSIGDEGRSDDSKGFVETSNPSPLLESIRPGLAPSGDPLDKRVLFGEFLATFLLVHFSVMAASSSPKIAGPFPNAAVISALAAAFIPVSGAHFNPAVTLALLAANQVPLKRAIAFVPLQLLASVLASLLALALGASLNAPGIPATTAGVALFRAIASETIPMFFIICVVFLTAVAPPKEGGTGSQLAPLYIALAVLGCISAFPNAVFNPARAFGPALLERTLSKHWVYWLGPIIGAVAAAWVCYFVFFLLFSTFLFLYLDLILGPYVLTFSFSSSPYPSFYYRSKIIRYSQICEHWFLAPAGKRRPSTWFAKMQDRYANLIKRVKMFGMAGIISYGILNTLYYSCTFTLFMIRVC